MADLSVNYWDKRYLTNEISWDIGAVSAPLKEYIDQLKDLQAKILIPGAGNAYEAEYLYLKGFRNVYLLDISSVAIENFIKRCPDFPQANIFHEDFFEHSYQYDLILEQTFFCALDPDLRQAYADKMKNLLVKGGKLVGVLFNRSFEKNPPFGGTREEYLKYFASQFKLETFGSCYNSIPPRKGSEIFIQLLKE